MKQVFTTLSGRRDHDSERYNYCPTCGTELAIQENAGRQRPTCTACGFVYYRNPRPGVVVVLERDGAVLLGRRRGGFGAGKWGLPQGYVEYDESFLGAAIREVKEETGLEIEIRSILNVVSNLLSPGLHTLAIILLAHVTGGEQHAGDDLDALQWVPLPGPLPEMAFEADEQIIARVQEIGLEGGLPVDPRYARQDACIPSENQPRRPSMEECNKLTLDRPYTYQIKVPGELDESWADWDGKLTVTIERQADNPPVTTLTGVLDQAALHSLLRRLYALGLPLISVHCAECSSCH